MKLRPFLEKKSLAELQQIHLFWTNSTGPAGRTPLLSGLEKVMSDDGTVEGKFSFLTPKQRYFLEMILRQPGFEAGLNGLLRGRGRDHLLYSEVETLSSYLIERGWVERLRTKEEGYHYFVPEELGVRLVNRFDILERLPEELVSLQVFLGSLDKRDFFKRVMSHQPEGAPFMRPADFLKHYLAQRRPAGSRAALRASHPALAELVEYALLREGGILTKEVAFSLPLKLKKWEGALWRRLLEEQLLGTLGRLNLKRSGIDLDEEVLILFQEVVETELKERMEIAAPSEGIESVGVNFVSDLSTVVEALGSERFKLRRDGAFYKRDLNRLAKELRLLATASVRSEIAVEKMIRLATHLELLSPSPTGVLRPTEYFSDWEQVVLQEKMTRLFNKTVEDAFYAHPHYRRLREILISLLKRLSLSAWYDPELLMQVARAQFLQDLLLTPAGLSPRGTSTPPIPLRTLEEEILRWMTEELLLLGVVEIARRGQAIKGIRLSPLWKMVFSRAGEEPASSDEKHLVINPDFEIILFPSGFHYELSYELRKFAAPVKLDQTEHFRVTRASIERAMVRGQRPEAIEELLVLNSRRPVPQNVLISIRDWSSRVFFVDYQAVQLLRAPSREIMDILVSLPEARDLVGERLSPTVAITRGRALDRNLLDSLQKMGIYLRK